MNDAETRFNNLIAKLHQRNYRMTPQRLALIRLIASSEDHPDATQLFERARVQFPTMSQATVYKTLDLLKEMNEVLEIDLHGDSHYDGNLPHPHPHLICTRCGKIMDGELEFPVQNLVQEIEASHGFQVTRHQLIFYGLCPECQQEA